MRQAMVNLTMGARRLRRFIFPDGPCFAPRSGVNTARLVQVPKMRQKGRERIP
jgi:hypothetical protein